MIPYSACAVNDRYRISTNIFTHFSILLLSTFHSKLFVNWQFPMETESMCVFWLNYLIVSVGFYFVFKCCLSIWLQTKHFTNNSLDFFNLLPYNETWSLAFTRFKLWVNCSAIRDSQIVSVLCVCSVSFLCLFWNALFVTQIVVQINSHTKLWPTLKKHIRKKSKVIYFIFSDANLSDISFCSYKCFIIAHCRTSWTILTFFLFFLSK